MDIVGVWEIYLSETHKETMTEVFGSDWRKHQVKLPRGRPVRSASVGASPARSSAGEQRGPPQGPLQPSLREDLLGRRPVGEAASASREDEPSEARPSPAAETAAEAGGAGPARVPEEGEELRGVIGAAHAAGAAEVIPGSFHMGSGASGPVPWESALSPDGAECLSVYRALGSETGSELDARVRDIEESLRGMGKSQQEILMATRIEYAKAELVEVWQAETQQAGTTEGIRDWALRKFTEDDYRDFIALGSSPEEVEARVRACGRWAQLPYAIVTRHLDCLLYTSPSPRDS